MTQDRSVLVRIEESLVREVARLKQELETRANAAHEVDPETLKALEVRIVYIKVNTYP